MASIHPFCYSAAAGALRQLYHNQYGSALGNHIAKILAMTQQKSRIVRGPVTGGIGRAAQAHGLADQWESADDMRAFTP
jgi:hypothetical protein